MLLPLGALLLALVSVAWASPLLGISVVPGTAKFVDTGMVFE